MKSLAVAASVAQLFTAIAWAPAVAQGVRDGVRGEAALALGGPFVIFRDKVMDELKMTDEQRHKLSMRFQELAKNLGPFFDSFEKEKQADRVKKLAEHRQEAHKKLATFLKATLQPDQLKRFRQINIRYEGLFGLAEADRAEVVEELKLNEAQQRKLTAIAQELQKAIAPLKVPEGLEMARKIRREQNDKIKAILTEVQNKQLREILGQPFALNF